MCVCIVYECVVESILMGFIHCTFATVIDAAAIAAVGTFINHTDVDFKYYGRWIVLYVRILVGEW